MADFELLSCMKPCGDQPQAIDRLTTGLQKGYKEQILLGVTGSGKTFTMANVIARSKRPALVISHNKTLAAQLYSELREFFPNNAVEYFVSYYDYYQPEAYIPHTDTYIAKDASINQDLDRLRLSATSSILSRDDVIVVASVSAIYNIGSPEDWSNMVVTVKQEQKISRDDFLVQLVDIQYDRMDQELARGGFRVRGDVVDLYPSYLEEELVRFEFFGDEIEAIYMVNEKTGKKIQKLNQFAIYPAKQFVQSQDRIERAMVSIRDELSERIRVLEHQDKILEAKRLQSRTQYDMEMMRELGYCSGIENYSRHLSGRPAGSRPYSLLDYFGKDLLVVIDESHVTIPQIRGMFNGDRARKQVLVDHGFRLPSAMDNRPLKFEEFEHLVGQVVYVSATPGPYEKERADQVAEQLVRPTGIVDPIVEVRSTKNQIDNLIEEVKTRVSKKERVLVTTLTKRMSEDLSRYLAGVGIRVKYLHSEIDAIERVEILKGLRMEKFDCLVGVNLLREGLDLPEVSLVIILDADKEGFLRSEVSLIQTAGRAARHVEGRVIMYADRVTDSMNKMISECERRREVQLAYNKENKITPKSIVKAIKQGIELEKRAEQLVRDVVHEDEELYGAKERLAYLERKMEEASRALEFERAGKLRDKIIAFAKENQLDLPWEE